MNDTSDDSIRFFNNEDRRRFEAHVDGSVAVVEYIPAKGRIVFSHTEVPAELEGKGVAGRLVKTALEYARDEKLDVIPLCPFVAAYIRRHPEYAELVQAGYRV